MFGKLKFKIPLFLIIFVLIAGAMIIPASAEPKIGDKLGDIVYSNVTAYINGHQIPTSAAGNTTLINVEDLKRYGFEVVFNNTEKTLKVTLNPSKKFDPLKVEANTGKPGEPKGIYVYTDIKTYLNGNYVDSYNVNGYTMIDFESLDKVGKFGKSGYDREKQMLTLQTEPKIGDKLGDIVYSNVTAYINGQPIPTSAAGNTTLINVDDLKKYGFDVVFDNAAKTLKVTLNPNKKFDPLPVNANTGKPGDPKGIYVYTDIKTYLNGNLVEMSYNFNGYTMIDFELLDKVGKFGKVEYNRENQMLTLSIANNAVEFKNLAANGSDTVATTQLTLTFDRAIPGLSERDITVTGATKGTLSGAGPAYYLAISNITVNDGAEVTVTVAKNDFTITPASMKVAVSNPGYQFTNLTANGNLNTATNQLTLYFDRVIPGLSERDITVTGATRGTLSGTGPTYYLAISDITVANGQNITVSVSKSGYLFNPSSRTVAIYKPAVTFTLTQNGSDSLTTSQISIKFNTPVPNLSANDITVTDATKGNLTVVANTNNTEYTLVISNIRVSDKGYIYISINKTGYEFNPSSSSIQVRVLPNRNVTMSQNGAAGANNSPTSSDARLTTEITITLDSALTGSDTLTTSNISITVPSGRSSDAVRRDSISVSSNNRTYTLKITLRDDVSNPIRHGDKITVKIEKAGYNFTPTSVELTVYKPDVTTVTATFAAGGTPTNQLTVYLSQAVTGFVPSDISISGGTLGSSWLSASGGTYTVSLTPNSTGTANGYITINNITRAGYTFTVTNTNSRVTITSSVAVTNITLSSSTVEMGKTLTLVPTVVPSNATKQTPITWTMVNDGGTNTTITSSGTFNATSATGTGTATVRATIIDGKGAGNNYTQDFNITVTAPARSIVISGAGTVSGVGNTIQLTATTTEPTVIWSFTEIWMYDYATIDASGLITVTQNPPGNITLTVRAASTDGQVSNTANVTVLTFVPVLGP